MSIAGSDIRVLRRYLQTEHERRGATAVCVPHSGLPDVNHMAVRISQDGDLTTEVRTARRARPQEHLERTIRWSTHVKELAQLSSPTMPSLTPTDLSLQRQRVAKPLKMDEVAAGKNLCRGRVSSS